MDYTEADWVRTYTRTRRKGMSFERAITSFLKLQIRLFSSILVR